MLNNFNLLLPVASYLFVHYSFYTKMAAHVWILNMIKRIEEENNQSAPFLLPGDTFNPTDVPENMVKKTNSLQASLCVIYCTSFSSVSKPTEW